MKVAPTTTEREVGRHRRTAVLAGDYVVDLVTDVEERFGDLAVLAAVPRPPSHFRFEVLVHP
jgi:hypothetical protein